MPWQFWRKKQPRPNIEALAEQAAQSAIPSKPIIVEGHLSAEELERLRLAIEERMTAKAAEVAAELVPKAKLPKLRVSRTAQRQKSKIRARKQSVRPQPTQKRGRR